MSHDTLCIIWFFLLGALLCGYAILDGFDLGIGIMHPFLFRADSEREKVLGIIGPVWDGNEVWLVTFGGAMFAMFPLAYASIFSGLYSAVMLVLIMLIGRALSLEFRSNMASPARRHFWDWIFSASSFGVAFLFGLLAGNAMQGLPIGEDGAIKGGFTGLLRLYPIAVGLLAASLFALHGAIYLYLKTDETMRKRVRIGFGLAYTAFIVLFASITIVTVVHLSASLQAFHRHPILWGAPVLNLFAIASIPRFISRQPARAFMLSSGVIAGTVFLIGATLFPNLVVSSTGTGSIDIYSAASSQKTLSIGLAMAAIGMPCVVFYTLIVYRTFRTVGQVRTDPLQRST